MIERPSDIRFHELFNAMFSESDRGCILIGASVLDSLLGDSLKGKLSRDEHVVKKAVEPLYASLGPLASFSARIKFAYCLDLIERWEFEDLENIRKIRNRAAHEYTGKSFDHHDIVEITKRLNGADRAVVAIQARESVPPRTRAPAETPVRNPPSIEPPRPSATAEAPVRRPPSMERTRFEMTVCFIAAGIDALNLRRGAEKVGAREVKRGRT